MFSTVSAFFVAHSRIALSVVSLVLGYVLALIVGKLRSNTPAFPCPWMTCGKGLGSEPLHEQINFNQVESAPEQCPHCQNWIQWSYKADRYLRVTSA